MCGSELLNDNSFIVRPYKINLEDRYALYSSSYLFLLASSSDIGLELFVIGSTSSSLLGSSTKGVTTSSFFFSSSTASSFISSVSKICFSFNSSTTLFEYSFTTCADSLSILGSSDKNSKIVKSSRVCSPLFIIAYNMLFNASKSDSSKYFFTSSKLYFILFPR